MIEMSDEDRIGAAHRGGRMDPTNGIQSLHFQSPDDAAMAREEHNEDDERASEIEMQVEAMRRFIGYLFGDALPKKLCYATRRLYSVAREFYPHLLIGVSSDCMESIYEGALSDDGVSARRCDSIAQLLSQAGDDGRGYEVRDETVGRLMCFIFSDDRPSQPAYAMRRVYALAKSFCSHAINGMSLHDIGKTFGEGDNRGNRARWSARIKVLVIKTVAESGAVAHMKYQKSASTCRKYSAAQRGNQNRRKQKQ